MLERLAGVRVANAHGANPRVELVLQDDRGRLAVHPLAVGAALGGRRRAAGTAALHRPQALLGAMARQALVAERDRPARKRRERSAAQARVLSTIAPSAPDASSGSPTTSCSSASPATRRRAAASAETLSPRGTVARARARGPGSSAAATPIRRSPRSIPISRVTWSSGRRPMGLEAPPAAATPAPIADGRDSGTGLAPGARDRRRRRHRF